MWTHSRSYADAAVDETSPEARGLEVRILLRAGHLDAPHLLPGVVQLQVHRVDARVVGGHGVAHVGGDPVFLVDERGEKKTSKKLRFSRTAARVKTFWKWQHAGCTKCAKKYPWR